jgi:hypothetical protein
MVIEEVKVAEVLDNALELDKEDEDSIAIEENVVMLDPTEVEAVKFMLELVTVALRLALLEVIISTVADFSRSLTLELSKASLLEIELTDVGLAVLTAA